MKTTRRSVLLGAVGLCTLAAGCTEWRGSAGDPGTSPEERTFSSTERETTEQSTTTQSPAYTTLPEETYELPEGPKSPPAQPETWNESAARSYVISYEERHVYNTLYNPEVEEINVSCNVAEFETLSEGYRVVVLCQGAAYVGDDGQHGDYIGKRITYLVADGTAIRLEPGVNATTTTRR